MLEGRHEHVGVVLGALALTLAVALKRAEVLDPLAERIGERLPPVRRAGEHRRRDGWLDLDAVERQHLERVLRVHQVGVEHQPAERRSALGLLVGDEERIATRTRRAVVAVLERTHADQHADEVRLGGLVDVELTEDQYPAGVEQLLQAPPHVVVGECGERIETGDLGPERGGEVLHLEVGHAVASHRLGPAVAGRLYRPGQLLTV